MGQVINQQQPLQPTTTEVVGASSATNPMTTVTATTPKVKPLSAHHMQVSKFWMHKVLHPSHVTWPLSTMVPHWKPQPCMHFITIINSIIAVSNSSIL